MRNRRSRLLAVQLVLCCTLFGVSPRSLAQAPGQVPAANLFRIAGTMVSASEGHPLARVRVSLQEVKNPKTHIFIITGDDGHFAFANLAAGKYSLLGAKRGYISAAYDQHEQFSTAIVTGAGVDTEHLFLRLAPTAVISGHVFDEFGEPVRAAAVTLWRDDHSGGIARTVRDRVDRTDDLGSFEFSPLNAGTYFISAAATPWYAIHPPVLRKAEANEAPEPQVDRNLDVVYVPTYYAGATKAECASPILVRGGDSLDLDLRLSPVPALHVIVHGPVPQENAPTTAIPVLLKRDLDTQQQPIQGAIEMRTPGVFEITAAPGKYELRLAQRDNEPNRSSEVEISQDNQEFDASAGQAGSNISAKVEMMGEGAPPSPMVFALRNAQNRVVDRAELSAAREISFTGVVPGKYEVLAGAPGRAYSVASMTVNGSPVSGRSLTVPAGTNLTLSLSVIAGATDVSGVAQHEGKGAAGAMIVLVPKNPESNRDLFRRDQSDLDGTFIFHSVFPGAYTVVGIENGWDLDWAKPAVIAHYAAHGQRVVVGGSPTIALPGPVEIVAK